MHSVNWGNGTPSTSNQDETVAEAGEVFIYMHRQYRVSRNIRAHWYFDHINKDIVIEDQPQYDEYGREMSVVGIIAKNGKNDDFNIGKKFKVSLDTKVTYISRFYRHVFILDLSPSAIVADEETNCCLHSKLLECLRLSMASVTQSFTIPGTRRRFSPQIYISVIVFIPFLGFEDDLVLVHGTLLTESNIEDVLKIVTAKFNKLLASLCNYSRPILNKWGQLRRRHRNRFDSACEPDTENLGSYMEETRLPYMSGLNEVTYSGKTNGSRKRHPLRPLDFPKQIWKVSESEDGSGQADAKCDGYIFPEWALIFMLRLGLIAVQTLPENTQSNVIVITDAVAGMPDSQALQELLNQIRSYTVSCSFIQLKGRARSEACFGHVSSCELFHFLAMATFGAYIPNCKCSIGVDMNKKASYVNEASQDELIFQKMNSFHRALICWSFQNALQDNLHITNLVNEINPTFAELYKSDTVRHHAYSSTYNTTIHEILYVRLREGFTLKTVDLLPETSQIKICLSMPFRPLIFIEYTIRAAWPVDKRKRGPIQIDLEIEAPYNEIKDLLTNNGSNAASANIARLKLLKSLNTTVEGIMSADKLLLHIHSFNVKESYYNVPDGIRDLAIFHTGENRTGQPMVREAKMRGYNVQDNFGEFLCFWRVLCGMNDGIWQKWVHMHFDRVILRSEKVPTDIFSDYAVKIDCDYSKDVLHKLLKERSSFCLIKEKLYVTFVKRENEQVPSYFYMVRVSHEPPCIVMKTAFLGGLNSTERRNVMEEFRAQLLTLRIDLPEPSRDRSKLVSSSKRKKSVTQEALWLIRRPLERILVRYEQIPADLRTIVRIINEETGNEKDLTMHNAISKYLQCRRKIWKLNGSQVCNGAALRKLVDFILNVLLRKRLLDKFKVAWTNHGIVGCCRQVIVRELGAALEQAVLFPPTAATFYSSDNCEEILIRPTAIPSSPRDMGPFLVISELWREPGADLDDIDKENRLNPMLKTDDKLVAVLYTVDSLIRVCDSENHSPLHKFTVEAIKNVRQISGCVQLINNSFNIDAVLQNSNRALLHFPTFEPANDSPRTDRIAILMSTLHYELEQIYDNFFTINEDNFFGRAMEDIFYQTRGNVCCDPLSRTHYFATKSRLYLRRINPWSISIALVPIGKITPNYYQNCIPVIVSVFDEAQLAYILTSSNRECIAHIREIDFKQGQDLTLMENWIEPMVYEIPEELISASRCIPEVRRSYSPVLLSTIVKEFSELIVERTVVKSLYIALRNDISIDATLVDNILTEHCQYADLDVEAVPGAIENFCLHMQDKNTSSGSGCCEVAHMEQLFVSTLARSGFTAVPNMPSYYFYDPKTEDNLHCAFDTLAANFQTIEEQETENLTAEELEQQRMIPMINLNCHKKADNPLFVYFHCNVTFTDGTEDSFPIHFLPSCVEHVMGLSKNGTKGYGLGCSRVDVSMYVMTCSPSRNRKQPRSLLDWDDEEEDIPQSKRNKMFLAKLPNKDRIQELLKNMNRLLELESVLMDSRKDFVTYERLQKVAKFIHKECQKGGESGHVEQRSKQVTMVLPDEKYKLQILDRLDGLNIGYCTLRKTENSNMFYACKVENEEEFRRLLKKTQDDEERRDVESRNSDDSPRIIERKRSIIKAPAFLPTELNPENESSLIYENGIPIDLKRPDIACDFWVIITIDDKISGQFCQRYKARHHQMFDLIWDKCRQIIKCVNQEILLERMYSERICDPLLVTPPNYEPEVRKMSREIPKSTKGLDDMTQNKDPLISTETRYLYPSGYFTCALQEKIWFQINERLQNDETQYGKAVVGWHVLSQALKDHIVNNIPNTYVVKESNGNIVYIQLYTNRGSFEAFIKHNKIPMRRGNKRRLNNYAAEKFKDHVLMACYSVNPPGKDITEDLALMLKTKLDNKVLNAIVLRAARLNHMFCLIPADIPFIQPEPFKPLRICYSSVPRDMSGYLSAVIYYAHQHLCTFMNLAQFSTDQEDKTPTFEPFFSDDKVPRDSYPTFYVFPSRSPLGIACVQTRLLAPDGSLAQVTHGVLRVNTHNQFVKYIPHKRSKFTAYREMTHTELYDEINPLKSGVCAYVEFVIWVIGNVKLPELESALLSCVELAHCDVVTEYGILNTNIFDNFTISTPSIVPLSPAILQPSSSSFSRSMQPKASPTAAVRRDALKKRDSTDSLVVSQPALPSTGNLPATPSGMTRGPSQTGSNQMTPVPQNSSSDGNIKKNSSVFSFENHSGGRRGSVASDIGLSGDSPTQTQGLCVNPKFLNTYSDWFEYVSERPISGDFDSLNTVIKFETLFESPFTARSALTEMGIRIEDTIKETNSAVKDTVYYCVHNDKPEYGGRFVVVPISAGNLDIDRAYCPEETCAADVMMVMMSTDLAKETIRYGYERTTSDPPAIFDEFVNNNSRPNVTSTEKQWENENRHLYFPNFKTGFIPRQRILIATLFSDVLTVYFYNFHPLVAREIRTILVRAANWHAARSNLVRQVGLHKMGISHLTPIHAEPVEKDERYEHLIWRMPEQLIDYTYPPYELHLPRPEPARIVNMLHRPFRFFDYEYVPYIAGPDANRCSLQATWRQTRLLRDQLVNKIDRSRMYKRMIIALMRGNGEISEEQLAVLLTVSRRIHFVQTPVLLFPKWRRKIAEVRGTVSPSMNTSGVISPLAKQTLNVAEETNLSPINSNTTPPRLTWTSQLRPRTNTLTKNPIGNESPQNGKDTVVEGAEPGEKTRVTPFQLEEEEEPVEKENGVTPLRFKSSDEDPVQVKILYMLMKDYVEYLTKLGMGMFTVHNMEKKSLEHNMYTIEYKQGCRHPPVITMYKACKGGIVIAHLSFNQPYFIINVGVVILPELLSNDLDSPISDSQKKELVMELEKIKDEIVSHCHLHSFTYDFHLRMLSKYLVGKDEVLFDPGYNTSSFLLDFLKYYGCRPPNARNCVYEERPTFKLKFDIQGNKVWDHFLAQQYVRKYGWKVVKIKNTEDDKETSGEKLQPHDYMLVSSEGPSDPEKQPPHEKLRVLLRDRRRREKRSTLNVVQYLILVDPIQCGPLDEERHRDDSKSSSNQGVFLSVERPSDAEKEAEIDSMMDQLEAGCLPYLDNVEIKPPPQRDAHGEEEVSTSTTVVDPKYNLLTDLESKLEGVDSDSSENLVAVKGSASRRHRKEVLSDDGEIPGENVTYVQYMSNKQRSLQDILESAASEYNDKLNGAVKDAEWECRRNDLWKLVLTNNRNNNKIINRPAPPKSMQSEASWCLLRSAQNEHTSKWIELEQLIQYVNVVDMSEREPRLHSLLLGTNCARLCRFLFARYTADRCRYFECNKTNKKRLIITNPDDAANSMFLVNCERETTPKLMMILKEKEILNENPNDESVKFRQTRLDAAFDELIQCVTASLWCDLLQKPPGRGKEN